MEQQELDFIKGFNSGYLLAKYEPDLANKLIKTPANENEYFKGIHLGKSEYDLEKAKSVSKIVTKEIDKDIEKEKEK